MSASREKKVRQEQESTGYTDPKTAKEAKERKEEKRSNTIYLLVAIAFVVVGIISLVWKSGITERNVTAVTIDGENYTAAETQYYYINNYQSFDSNYYYYLSYFGLDTSKSLKEQECAMTDDGSTWYDYFLNQATQQMAAIQSLGKAAKEVGMSWDESMQADYDAAMESLQSSTDSYNSSKGTSLSTKGYLQLIYGKLVNMSTYQKLVKNAILAQHYVNDYQDSLTYTADQLDSEYAANPNNYDYVNYEMISISGKAASTTDADGNTVDPTEEETAAALEALYAEDVIFPKYRHLLPMCSLWEYIQSGRCDKLEGPDGAYALLETEIQQKKIVADLGDLDWKEARIMQYGAYNAFQEIKEQAVAMSLELDRRVAERCRQKQKEAPAP